MCGRGRSGVAPRVRRVLGEYSEERLTREVLQEDRVGVVGIVRVGQLRNGVGTLLWMLLGSMRAIPVRTR